MLAAVPLAAPPADFSYDYHDLLFTPVQESK
jgi:hypothetical protein